jgi:hypothetical protein
MDQLILGVSGILLVDLVVRRSIPDRHAERAADHAVDGPWV